VSERDVADQQGADKGERILALEELVQQKDAEIQRLRALVRAYCPGEEDPRD